MRRVREAQLARLAARTTAAGDAAAWHSAALRARVKLGSALRQALAQSGIAPATVAMLRVSDEAALELAVTADRPELLDADAPPPPAGGDRDEASAGAFAARIDRLMRRWRDGRGTDLARASLAEALAWCLARPEAVSPPMSLETSEESGARLFAADLLQKQRQDGAR